MAPRKSKKRVVCFDTEQFVDDRSASSESGRRDAPSPPPTFNDNAPPTMQAHHTLYEGSRPAVRSFVEVPVAVTVPATGPVGVDDLLMDTAEDAVPELLPTDFSDDEGSIDGDAEAHPLEAIGLSSLQLTEEPLKARRKRTAGDHPLREWLPHIDTYVDELLRHESCDTSGCRNPQCKTLQPSEALFRCLDCQSSVACCQSCTLESHRQLPFHRIQRWNGIHFEKALLKTLGLRIQLGHDNGGSCTNPQPAFDDNFTIIDSDGIHSIGIDYCGCYQSLPKTVQLLRSCFFPSTVVDPKTAATFRVLETFQMLSFTSKVSAFEFYRSLVRRTDNTGTVDIPDRYQVFLRIVREWRHVRLLKRMARGHSNTGCQGTKEGECAVLCPACPIPDVNLPSDWQDRPQSEQWHYALFLGINANFRLKRMNVSTEERDPGLNHGYAYVVETTKFKQYLEEYDKRIPDDKSTCNNHDAIKSASMRGGKGTAASGLGTIECSRHDMKRPVSVGDLQKGERYVNMDYFFLSSLQHNPPPSAVVSYDIACQWSCNLSQRCSLYPPNVISTNDPSIIYLVPKFHLPAHVIQCQVDYSFNLVPHVGRTDGEAPERGWSVANVLASSTKEMGPGSRRDTLDDHFGNRNWEKIVNMAQTFVRKAQEAMLKRQENVDAFIEFNAALPPGSTTEWKIMCQTWEADRSSKNPFKNERVFISDSEIRLRLAQEDTIAITTGSRPSLHENVTPAMLVYQGLELEDLQQRHTSDATSIGLHSTNLQKAKHIERSNALQRKVDAWIEIQQLYIPSIAILRVRADHEGGGTPIRVKDINLYLPSSVLNIVPIPPYLLEYEWKLRYSHAEGALNELRGLLLMRSMVYKSKNRHSRGQRQNTRSQTLIARVEAKVQFVASRYRRIRTALVALSGPLLEFDWVKVIRELADSDIVGLSSTDSSESEGRKTLTWIWKVQGVDLDTDKSTQTALRIEWCRARARAHRWQEECLLLREEMEQVLRFFKWDAQKWRNLALKTADVGMEFAGSDDTSRPLSAAHALSQSSIQRGKSAYAYKQAAIRDALFAKFQARWGGLDTRLLQMVGGDAAVMIECD